MTRNEILELVDASFVRKVEEKDPVLFSEVTGSVTRYW